MLLKRAEDNRDHLVVILAGYPEGMDRLLAANPGLSSRFTTRVDFPSYRPLELTSIGEVLAAENGDVWDEEALDELRSISGHVVDQGWIDELGNGRFLRTLYEKSCAYRDLRLSGYPGDADPGRPVDAAAAGSDAGVRRGAVGARARGSVGRCERAARGCAPAGPGPSAGSAPDRSGAAPDGRRRSARRPPPGSRCAAARAQADRLTSRWAGSRTSPTSISRTSSRATRPSTLPDASATWARWVAARRITVSASSSGSSARRVVIGRQICCGTARSASSRSRTSLTCR